MKYLIKALLPEFIIKYIKLIIQKNLYQRSYNPEDMLIRHLFSIHTNSKLLKNDGFYVDVGAYHPTVGSMTYSFYRDGWNGINVDANIESINDFKRMRSRDINIFAAVSDTEDTLKYHKYEVGAVNTLSTERSINDIKGHTLIDTIDIETKRLDSILDSFLPNGKKIDFFSVDAEGFDLKVLKSNNWKKYRPTYVYVEERMKDIYNPKKNVFVEYMSKINYKLITVTPNNLLFEDTLLQDDS